MWDKSWDKQIWTVAFKRVRELKRGVLKSINRCELCKEFHFFLQWDALNYTLKKPVQCHTSVWVLLLFKTSKFDKYSSTVRFYKPCILLWLFKFVFHCFYYPFIIGPTLFFCLNVHWNSSVSSGNFEIFKLAFKLLNQRTNVCAFTWINKTLK